MVQRLCCSAPAQAHCNMQTPCEPFVMPVCWGWCTAASVSILRRRRGRYFICADTVLIMQFIYYGTLQRRRERLRSLRSRPRPHHAPPHHRLHAPSPHAHALPPYRPLPSEVRMHGSHAMQTLNPYTALLALLSPCAAGYHP